jgi:hypothetical protein
MGAETGSGGNKGSMKAENGKVWRGKIEKGQIPVEIRPF